MAEEQHDASKSWDFRSTAADMPNLKALIGKVAALPGVAPFKGLQIQMLRVQGEFLKAQMQMIEQVIQALETSPEEPVKAPTNGKIKVS